MSTILIQTRVDEYTTPELYAELEAIPAGNARTTRLKNLANEALILKRQLGLTGAAQAVDSQHFSGADSFTQSGSGKNGRRPKVKDRSEPPAAADLPPASPASASAGVRAAASESAPGSDAQPRMPGPEASAPATQGVTRPVSTGARAASRVLSMNTLRGG